MKLYGLLGYPLSHSFSKDYFTRKFQNAEYKDCAYQNFELQSLFDIKNYLNSFEGLKGFNITIPYKEQILNYLDRSDKLVESINACNCISVIENEWIGYNTDVIGFELSFKGFLKPNHTKALILGTGGASKAVAYVCRKLGLEFLFISKSKKGEGYLSYEALNEDILQEYQVIINTTPVGSYPANSACPDIPYQFITSQHYLFDLIYNPEKTEFLMKGQVQGAQIRNGYEMLVIQAEESWKIWNTNYL